MASVLLVDKLDPQSGTALEIGTSGDTVTVPSGVGLTLTDSTLLLPTTITSTTEVKTNKISPATGVAFALGDSGDTFTVPSGATIVNSGTATGFGINQTSFLPIDKPLVINGDMAVSQRATSATGVTAGSWETVDRWTHYLTTAGTWTITQDTASAPTDEGFGYATKWDNTTANASLSADSRLFLDYIFEGQDLQMFKKGTANAEKFTLAFWVNSTKTGTFIAELFDSNSRTCSQSYTVDTTNTWEKKIINFPADTSGTLPNSNARGLEIYLWFAAGTDYTSGSLNTTWAANVNANRAVGQVNCADSTSNNFLVTGVQMEVGEYTSADLPPFRHESYAANLLRCQRYLVRWDADGAYSTFAIMAATTTAEAQTGIQLPVNMRTSAPGLTSSGAVELFGENASPNVSSLSTATAECSTRVFHLKAAATLTQGSAYCLRSDNNTSAYFYIDTEL